MKPSVGGGKPAIVGAGEGFTQGAGTRPGTVSPGTLVPNLRGAAGSDTTGESAQVVGLEVEARVRDTFLQTLTGGVGMDRDLPTIDLTDELGVLNPNGIVHTVTSLGSGSHRIEATGQAAFRRALDECVVRRYAIRDPAGNAVNLADGGKPWLVYLEGEVDAAVSGDSMVVGWGVATQPSTSAAGGAHVHGLDTFTGGDTRRSVWTTKAGNPGRTAVANGVGRWVHWVMILPGSSVVMNSYAETFGTLGTFRQRWQPSRVSDASAVAPELWLAIGFNDSTHVNTKSVDVTVRACAYPLGS